MPDDEPAVIDELTFPDADPDGGVMPDDVGPYANPGAHGAAAVDHVHRGVSAIEFGGEVLRGIVGIDLTDWIVGTDDQVIATDDGDGTVTLSTPQDIATTSSPTFAGLTLTGNLAMGGNDITGVDDINVADDSFIGVASDVGWIFDSTPAVSQIELANGALVMGYAQRIYFEASGTTQGTESIYSGGNGYLDRHALTAHRTYINTFLTLTVQDSMFRLQGDTSPTYPTSGAGLEIAYDADAKVGADSGGTGAAIILSLSRGPTSWRDIWFRAKNFEFQGTHVSGVGLARFKGRAGYAYLSLDSTTAGASGFLVRNNNLLIGQWGCTAGTNDCHVKNRVYGAISIMTWQADGHTLVYADRQIQFNDTGTYIYSRADSYLTLVADGAIEAKGIFDLEATTSSTGHITRAGTRLLHTYGGVDNFFAGVSSGNFTMVDAIRDVGVGQLALTALISGDNDTLLGFGAGAAITDGSHITGVGSGVLAGLTTGHGDTACGSGALTANNGDWCVALGYNAGFHETGDNKLFIDNNSRANEADARITALIYGIFDAESTANQLFRVNGVLEVLKGAKLGANGVTNYMGVGSTGLTTWHGAGGVPHAEVWVLGNAVATAIAGAGTFVQFLGFANDGNALNAVPDHTNDHITITTSGKYLVVCSFGAESVAAGGADIISIEIRKNNGTVTFSNLHAHRTLAGGGRDKGSISVSGIVDLNANDTLEVWLTNDDSADDILVADANMSVVMVGGT